MSTVVDKIIMSFAWEGPNMWKGGCSLDGLDVRVVDLVFKDAKTKISVDLPENINPVTAQKFPFTCRRYAEKEMTLGDRKIRSLARETHPELLKVTVEQIHNLTVKAGFFEKGKPIGPKVLDPITGEITQQETVRRSDRNIELKIPEELEVGQKYSLVVKSDDELSLSAQLIREKKAPAAVQEKRKDDDEAENLVRMLKMGKALLDEANRNFELASKGEFFNSSSTAADLYAQGMQGVARAYQKMYPDFKVPNSTPSVSSSELDELTIQELQSRFEETSTKDKELEEQRRRAFRSGDTERMNKAMQDEFTNSQLLISLGEALERKGVSPQIPQTKNSQRGLNNNDAPTNSDDACKIQ